jgi:hypothetical protein
MPFRDKDIEESWYEEFRFPFCPGEAPLTPAPSPWIRQFFGLDAIEVNRILAEERANIQHPSLKRFRDRILLFQAFALAHDYKRWSVGMINGQWNFLYLPSPLDLITLANIISSYNFIEHELILDFYTYFYGIRNGPADYGIAKFHFPEHWDFFESYGWEDEIKRFDPDRRWARSLIIYSDGMGNTVLLSPTYGDTAWAVLTEKPPAGPFVPFTPTFASFLDVFPDAPTYDAWVRPMG